MLPEAYAPGSPADWLCHSALANCVDRRPVGRYDLRIKSKITQYHLILRSTNDEREYNHDPGNKRTAVVP